jgi:hypothetical protein
VRIQPDAGRSCGQDQHIEDLLKANGRKRSELELAVSPYTKPIKPEDFKRYRDAGADEVVLIKLAPPRDEKRISCEPGRDCSRMG